MARKKKNRFLKLFKILSSILLGGAAIYIVVNVNNCSGDQTIISNEGDGVEISNEQNQAVPVPQSNASSPTALPTPIKTNERTTDNPYWESEDVTGYDSSGRSAKFNIAVLTPSDCWKFASHTETETGILYRVLPPYLTSLPNFNSAIGYVAVGVASERGNRNKEVNRGRKRADNIASVIQPLIQSKSLYTLNMGQYKIPTNKSIDQTDWQRRVIAIGILSIESGMTLTDIEVALKDAMTRSRRFIIVHEDYSNFDFVKL